MHTWSVRLDELDDDDGGGRLRCGGGGSAGCDPRDASAFVPVGDQARPSVRPLPAPAARVAPPTAPDSGARADELERRNAEVERRATELERRNVEVERAAGRWRRRSAREIS